MVLRHQIRPTRWDIKMFNRGIAPQRDTKMATKKRRPKNQWLMSRRIVSFADGLIFLMQMCNKCHLSGKEQIRLWINHWFFGRRNSTCSNGVVLKKQWIYGIGSVPCACITTNGFKASYQSHVLTLGMHKKANGFEASIRCLITRHAVQPMVLRHQIRPCPELGIH